MNNKNLIDLINLYGGNDDPQIYTSSVLNKYNKTLPISDKDKKEDEDTVFIKIKNLEKLFVKDSESEDDSFSNLLGGSNNNNIIKINNLYNINTYETDSFTEYVIKKIKNKTKYR